MDSPINRKAIERPRVTADEKLFFADARDKFEDVKDRWVTDQLHSLDPLPAAILDIGKVRVNCQRMIDATRRLGLLWRPHVKTHKTIQLTRLQVGDEDATPVNIVVSTLAEARMLLPLMKEYKQKGREVNMLYSFPAHKAAMAVIEDIHKALGENGLTLMVDHPDQVHLIDQHANDVGHKMPVFIKIDTGYHRAGVLPDSPECDALISRVLESERSGNCFLHGLYSHASHSYNGQDSRDAISVLCDEFEGIYRVARSRLSGRERPLVLSVGATPTATAVQNPGVDSATSQDGPETKRLRDMMAAMKTEGFALEVHAGVYPTLDLQQLATHARGQSLMTHDDIALTILAEVVSLYPGRGQNNTTEALITAGSLALGREPVQGGRDYSGWGIMTPWRSPLDLRLAHERGEDLPDYPTPGPEFPKGFKGWEVGRISQEHGILVWKGRKEDEVPLKVGQQIRLWPNHACIAGAGFDYYAVVDSSLPESDPDANGLRSEEVLDMWLRTRGW